MIKKHIGLLRNIISKRQEIIAVVKQVIESENILIVSLKDHRLSVSGHTANSATTVFMLGKAIATAYPSAKTETPDLTVHDFLTQPVNVAVAHLEQEGML